MRRGRAATTSSQPHVAARYPLHNDLDAYALAYGIATLMTTLLARARELFWQQASTAWSVRDPRTRHCDYVTLFRVRRHQSDKLRA